MKTFYNCFLAITLPSIFQDEFKLLLKQVRDISSEFEISDLPPHITIEYFGEQTDLGLEAVSQKVRENLKLLKGNNLIVGGFGYFDLKDPRVIYLNVNHHLSLANFVETFRKKDDLPFYAHVTVARMNNKETKKAFDKNRENLKRLLDKINWQFDFSKLDLYVREREKGEFRILEEIVI